MAAAGIRAWYSPRHGDLDGQKFQLNEMGPQKYRQECGVEFVEPDDMVFSYEDIDRLMNARAEPIGTR
jgi:hypothetical protein